jgi:hypothetical protein
MILDVTIITTRETAIIYCMTKKCVIEFDQSLYFLVIELRPPELSICNNCGNDFCRCAQIMHKHELCVKLL